jgi:hypothetical protein
MVLTVPNCSGEELGATVKRMTHSFKTLTSYLNGNKAIKGIDLQKYGFSGCLRSFEVTYGKDTYHPHFHVAAVFNNPIVADNKYIVNQFSKSDGRQFSDFEALIQRIWYLLINKERLTNEAVTAEGAEFNRNSCIVDKFQSEDYDTLFWYMTKSRSEENEAMSLDNFKTLFKALDGTRQIQGYGVFYNAKTNKDDNYYTEDEYAALAKYITEGEEPVRSVVTPGDMANDNDYIYLKRKARRNLPRSDF